MKKLLLILLFTLVPVGILQAWFINEHWTVQECAICGKTVYIWQETQSGPYMPSVVVGVMPSGGFPPAEEVAETLFVEKVVCEKCQAKYSQSFEKYTETFFEELRLKNKKLIEKHKTERKQKKIESHKAEIKILEEKLRRLKEVKK